MTNGGHRPGSGRRHRDPVRVGCSLCVRSIWSWCARKRRLAFTGAGSWAGLLTENLIGGAVNRELRAVSQTGDGHAEAALNQLVSW
jgi:hypothetical protein